MVNSLFLENKCSQKKEYIYRRFEMFIFNCLY